MTPEGYGYEESPGICDALLAEGIPLSAKRLRARRGHGSYETCSADIKLYQRLRGLSADVGADVSGKDTELSEEDGEDEEERPLTQALAVPDVLPTLDPGIVERYPVAYREGVDLIVLDSHLRAAVAVLRCVQASLSKGLAGPTRQYARSQQGLDYRNRTSTPRWKEASDQLQAALPDFVQWSETLVQAVTSAIQEESNGNRRPAA